MHDYFKNMFDLFGIPHGVAPQAPSYEISSAKQVLPGEKTFSTITAPRHEGQLDPGKPNFGTFKKIVYSKPNKQYLLRLSVRLYRKYLSEVFKHKICPSNRRDLK